MSEENTETTDVDPAAVATQPAEGSASDEADAARAESEADGEPAVGRGSASDESHGGSGRSEAEASPDHLVRSARKVREGTVTSTGMDKTIVVTVTDRVRHAKYNKFVNRTKKLYTHDETNDAGVGDRVRVMETRPVSKSKRWRLVEILERAR